MPSLAAKRADRRAVAEMYRAAAAAVRPRPRVRPSTWAEKNVRLRPEQTARPGPFSADYKPWTRDSLDAAFDNPDKAGVIAMKPAQIGWSLNTVIDMACDAVNDPRQVMFITTDMHKAKQFSHDEFRPMVEGVRELRLAVEEAVESGERKLMHEVPVPGGKVSFAGAGTENRVVGRSFRDVRIDDFEASSDQLPTESGDLWTNAHNRVWTYRLNSRVDASGHPRKSRRGLHKLWLTHSDQRRWVFDCPHCEQPVFPLWRHVRMTMKPTTPDELVAKPDPETAVLECPHCGAGITDEQRSRNVWPMRLGGTGRYKSQLDPLEAARRTHVGLWVHRLCDPEVTVRELARLYVAALDNPSALMDFMNKTLGEPDDGGSLATIGEETFRSAIAAKASRVADIELPGGPLGVRFITVGIDVQAPRDNPLLYLTTAAFAGNGMAYILDLRRAQGWSWLFGEYLPRFEVRLSSDGYGPYGRGRLMGLAAWCVDASFETGQVLDNVRVQVWSHRQGSLVRGMATTTSSNLTAANPVMFAPEAKRRHPTRPELGLVDHRLIHRHTWLDRVMQRFAGDPRRVQVMCEVPSDWMAHMTANVLRPVEKLHGLAADRLEWQKPDEYRDDFAWSFGYCEVAAAMLCDLDRVHHYAESEAANVAAAATPQQPQRPRSAWDGGEREPMRGWGGRG